MAIVQFPLAVPAVTGVGASTDISTLGEHWAVFVHGAFTGLMTIEASLNNIDFDTILSITGATGAQEADQQTIWVRIRRTGVTGGATPVVTVLGSNMVPAPGAITANQGTPGPIMAPWPVVLSNGLAAVGTAANPLRIDPTGTTTQPVSAAALPLPAGAATEATLLTRASQATVASLLAQLDVALSTRASEATLATILAGLTAALDVPLSTRASQATVASILAQLDVALSTRASEATLATRAAAAQLPAALVGGRLDENLGAWLGSTAPTVGQKTMAASVPTVIASDQTAIPTKSEGTTGAAVPAQAALDGGVDAGGLLRSKAVNAAGFAYNRDNASLAQAVADARVTGVAGTFRGSVATAAAVETAVRATAYVEQAANAQRSFSSSSAADTAAGAGARSIRLTYYSFVAGVMTGPFIEDIVLTGIAAVNTVSLTICFVEKIEVLTQGATVASPTGVVTMFAAAAGAGGAIASIAAGARSTRYAHHYVATGRTCFVQDGYASSTAAAANNPVFEVRSFDFSVAAAAEMRFIDALVSQGSAPSVSINLTTPQRVTGPARLLAYVTPTNAAAQSQFASFDFYDVPAPG